jgi:copper chaperone CopZ
MISRRCVRAISGRVTDVPGVRTVDARLDTRIVRVTGTAEAAAVLAAIGSAGYEVTAMPDCSATPAAAEDSPTAVEVDQ